MKAGWHTHKNKQCIQVFSSTLENIVVVGCSLRYITAPKFVVWSELAIELGWAVGP